MALFQLEELAGDTSSGKHAFDDATGPPKGKSARRAFAGPGMTLSTSP
jgi:hypothetical protein